MATDYRDYRTETDARAAYEAAARLRANCSPGSRRYVEATDQRERAYAAIRRFRGGSAMPSLGSASLQHGGSIPFH